MFGLREKKLEVKEIFENMGTLSETFLKLNPSGDLPVFVDGHIVCANDYVACEYLDEVYPAMLLIGESPENRAEVRRLLSLWDHQFYQDIYLSLFYEKVLKRKFQRKSPNTSILNQGRKQLDRHLRYFDRLAQERKFLGGNKFSWADISGAAHLSCIDYLGDIKWDNYFYLKGWYMKIKSRPAFRPFLIQTLPHITPAACYPDLDF